MKIKKLTILKPKELQTTKGGVKLCGPKCPGFLSNRCEKCATYIQLPTR